MNHIRSIPRIHTFSRLQMNVLYKQWTTMSFFSISFCRKFTRIVFFRNWKCVDISFFFRYVIISIQLLCIFYSLSLSLLLHAVDFIVKVKLLFYHAWVSHQFRLTSIEFLIFNWELAFSANNSGALKTKKEMKIRELNRCSTSIIQNLFWHAFRLFLRIWLWIQFRYEITEINHLKWCTTYGLVLFNIHSLCRCVDFEPDS